MILDNCQNADVSLVISPASPVQFWATDCLSHNEKEICGVYPQCFCAPWECDDEIKIPGVDYETSNIYSLAIIDSDGNEVDRVEFVQQELIYTQATDQLENFENIGSGTSWTIGATPSISLVPVLGTVDSKILAPPNELVMEPGVLYRIDWNLTKDAEDFILRTVLLDEDDNILDSDNTLYISGAGTFSNFSEFIAPSGAVKFGWYASHSDVGAGPTVDMNFNSYSVSRVAYFHLATVIPSDYNICDEQIELKIYNVTASPDTEDYHSDCLDIRVDHSCSLLIEYRHNQNIRGIIYTEGSPELTLNLRANATMRIQEFPQEDFAMELTTGVEKISSSLGKKTLFESDYAPYYFHEKLMMIFAHNVVYIDGKYWKKQDQYAPIEGDRKKALKMGEGLLTENFAFRLNS